MMLSAMKTGHAIRPPSTSATPISALDQMIESARTAPETTDIANAAEFLSIVKLLNEDLFASQLKRAAKALEASGHQDLMQRLYDALAERRVVPRLSEA